MKPLQIIFLAIVFCTICIVRAADQPAEPTQKDSGSPAASKPAGATSDASPNAAKPEAVAQTPDNNQTASAKPFTENGTNALRMNFRGASLEMVLNHLSEAAGFIINVRPGTSVRGKVDIWSNDPLTKEEALDLLDTVLIQNNLAAIRNGKVLTIVNRDEAKTQNVPVIQGGDPEKIPANDRIVTQIIPVRFVEVGQLLKDVQPLVSVTTQMTANEAGNAIVITDTQANIKKVVEVIHAIDMGAEDVTVVKVFHLQHADPAETAELLTSLFPDDSRAGGSQTPMQFGGPGGFIRRMLGGGGGAGGGGFGGGGGGGGNATSNSQNQRIRKRNRVVAVADARTSSVVVTASKDLMEQIQGVVAELDPDDANTRSVAVYKLENAVPQEALQVLQDMFNKTGNQNNRSSTANQNNPFANRSNAQSQQQNTTGSRTGTMGQGTRGGNFGGGGFGQ